jgi:hypothetical protein
VSDGPSVHYVLILPKLLEYEASVSDTFVVVEVVVVVIVVVIMVVVVVVVLVILVVFVVFVSRGHAEPDVVCIQGKLANT